MFACPLFHELNIAEIKGCTCRYYTYLIGIVCGVGIVWFEFCQNERCQNNFECEVANF